MPRRRLLTAGLAGSLLLASVAPAMAQEEEEATPGVGTSDGVLTVLRVDAGELLSVVLADDNALSNTNEAAGDLLARVGIVGASVSSETAGIDITTPALGSESAAGEAEELNGVGGVDESSTPALTLKLDPLNLSSAVDDDGARSGLDSTIDEVSAIGGLVRVDEGAVDLSTAANLTDSTTGRSLTLDELTVLDLGTLLDGLGISLLDLPIEKVLDLLTELGLDTALLEEVLELDFLNQKLPVVDLAATPSVIAVPKDLGDIIDDILNALENNDCESVTDDNREKCEDLIDLLNELLGLLGETLGGVSLLSLGDIDVSVTTLATETVDDSVAQINGTIGSVNVLGTDLGPVDLTDGLATLNDLVDEVNLAVNDLLAGLLGEVVTVDIDLLEQLTEVGKTGDLVTARASLVAAAATVAVDIEALEALIEGLVPEGTFREILDNLGIVVPETPIEELNQLLGGGEADEATTSALGNDTEVFALSDGVSVTAGELSQTSTFQVATQTTTTPGGDTPVELPRTGGSTLWLLLGAGALVIALGLRRSLTPVKG